MREGERQKDLNFLKDKQLEKDKKLAQEIKNVSEDFYQKIKDALDQISKIKNSFINKNNTANGFVANVHQQIDSLLSSLVNDTEKGQWKLIYQGVFNSTILPNLFSNEKTFLLDLAKKYNDNLEAERERERERDDFIWKIQVKIELKVIIWQLN